MKTNPSKHCLYLWPLRLFLGICVIVSHAFAQVEGGKKFSVVPLPIRGRLIERLNQFVEYDRTGQYEKKYDLFSEAYITKSWKGKAVYLKFIQSKEAKGVKETLISFDVSSVKDFSPNDSDDRIFHIEGVVKFRRGNKVIKKGRVLDARLQNGEWYFSDWLEETMILD